MKKIFFSILLITGMLILQSCSPIKTSNELGNGLHGAARDLSGAVLGPIVKPDQNNTVVVAESLDDDQDYIALVALSGERLQVVSRIEFLEIMQNKADNWIVSTDGKIYIFFKN